MADDGRVVVLRPVKVNDSSQKVALINSVQHALRWNASRGDSQNSHQSDQSQSSHTSQERERERERGGGGDIGGGKNHDFVVRQRSELSIHHPSQFLS